MRAPWKKLDARLVSKHRIFDLYNERFVSPRTGHEVDAVVLQAGDWVNVIARTADGACVMIRQFRYGNERETRHTVRNTRVVIHAHTLDLSAPPEKLLRQVDELASRIAITTEAEHRVAAPVG